MENPTSISAFRGGETFALERLKKVLEEIEEYHERLEKKRKYVITWTCDFDFFEKCF